MLSFRGIVLGGYARIEPRCAGFRKGEYDCIARRMVRRRAEEGREATASEHEGKAGPRCTIGAAVGGVGRKEAHLGIDK
jgi:hypothetical protein